MNKIDIFFKNGKLVLDDAPAVIAAIESAEPPVEGASFVDLVYESEPHRCAGWKADVGEVGIWVFVFADHWAIETMVDGHQDGPTAYVHPTGELQACGVERRGVRSGRWKHYERGVLYAELEYVAGVAVGYACRYHADGEPHLVGAMRDGLWVGDVEEYDDQGRLIGIGPMEGQPPRRTGHWRRFEEGERVAEGRMVDSVPVGRWTLYRDGRDVGAYDYDVQ